MAASTANRPSVAAPRTPTTTLAAVCAAHALHDGYTDALYVLLPLWRAEFALSYAAVGLLRALYSGVMAGFQVPASLLARRVPGGAVTLLALGTALAAVGYLAVGMSAGLGTLAAALVLSGLGSSVQHPLGASLVAHAYEGQRSRGALGTFNFSGDLGKMAIPAGTAALLSLMPWRRAASLLGGLGLLTAGAVWLALRDRGERNSPVREEATATDGDRAAPASTIPRERRGFGVLLAIGVIDSATRMGFLTFLPFLLTAKGAGQTAIGLALGLVFAGGAAGKFVCGILGARVGVLGTVCLTEGLTAAGILALLLPTLPLGGALALLPLVGVALNGTSSVLYGSVPELVRPEARERAFGIFYTGTIGSGALAPVLYGLVSDAAGIPTMMMLIAGAVLATLPLAWVLHPSLPRGSRLVAAGGEG